MKYEFYAGSYGKKEEESIVKFSLDGETGQIERIYGWKGVENPSWLLLNAGKDMLYAVEELEPEGRVCAFAVEEKGLRFVNSVSTKGAAPCHISMDGREETLFVSNYTGGSLAVCRLEASGRISEVMELIQHEGHGVNLLRQEGPHIHFTKVSGREIFTVDLGVDNVFIYEQEEEGRLKDTGKRIVFPAGEGPRHLEFHPEKPGLLYGVCELGNKLGFFREKGGEYHLEALLSTVPENFSGSSKAAAIRIGGGRLLVSNRGYDSLAVFTLDEDGIPRPGQIVPTGGKSPRDFEIFGNLVVTANQDSDELRILKFDEATGALEHTGISVPMVRPVCICRV